MDAKIDLILAAQDVQEADLKEMKKDIKQLKVDVGILPKIQEQMKQFKTDIRAVKDDVNTNKASILTIEARIDELTEANEALQKDLKQQHQPTTDEPSLHEKIEEHIRRLGKKKQIIIEGIAENQLTPLETLVAQIVHDTGVKITPQDIDQVFRVGAQMKHKPRAVLVTFTKQSTRDKIYRARLDIKTNPACKNIWLNEALDESQRQERSILRALHELAKEEGLESKNVGDILVIQGIKYTYATIDNLPPNITLEKAFIRETDDSIYFQSEHSWPSSFAPANFTYLGIPYSTLEQGYSHRMATKSGDNMIAQEILKEHRPRRCKALTKKIRNLKWTEDDAKEEMTALVHKKYQLPHYRKKLIESEGKRMVECTRDRKWAGGITLWSKEVRQNDKKLPGKNLLGDILEKERTSILQKLNNETPDPDHEPDGEDTDPPPPLDGDAQNAPDPDQNNDD